MANFDIQAFMASVRRMAGERGGTPPCRDLTALLRLEGADFILAAYRAILKREADPQALRGYADRSKNLAGRITILFSLLLSAEQTALPAPARRAATFCRRILHRSRARKLS